MKKRIGKQKLKEIIERHQHYLQRDVVEWEKMRADLQYADIRGFDLSDVNLRGANLCFADLRDANLCRAYLVEADLGGAWLDDADLRSAYLLGANLQGANLSGANLSGVCLSDADLHSANLRGTKLMSANLYGAYLDGADFEYANLATTNLDKKEEYRKGVILTESIKGWKRCEDDVYVELEIPKGAVVFCINGKRCRTNKAKVLSVSNGYMGRSLYDRKITYEVGEEIEIEDFDLMYNVEFGSGIHFFKTRKEAEKYYS